MMMDRPIPSLETQRLLLRPASTADLDIWAERIFADAQVMRYLVPSPSTPRERAERMLRYFNRLWEEHGFGEWIVTTKKDDAFLGHCGLGYLPETNEVEIDYALAREFWGQGIGTEAAHASLRYGIETALLDSIIGLVLPGNTASCRVLEHNGFIYQKDALYFGVDVIYYTLKAQDFTLGSEFYRLHEPDF